MNKHGCEMKLGIDICSSCGRVKQVYHEIMISNRVYKIYCKECYEMIYREISCKFCGIKMANNFYHQHLMKIHSG